MTTANSADDRAETRPYDGIKVLDATHVLAGPYCGYQFGLLGAEVIKIENPDEPDAVRERGPIPSLNDAKMGISYLAQGSNKKSLTLNLKSEEGRDILLRLAASADVFIENYRAGAFDGLSIGYEDIARINPSIIYCSITAFGQEGPWAQRNGYDPAIQAASGIMMRTGAKYDLPQQSGALFIDYATGLNAAFAVATALFHRVRTGRGQRIDCAMLDTALTMTGPALSVECYDGEVDPVPPEAGTVCYKTKDGYLQLGAFTFRQNERLWRALGRADFASFRSWPDVWKHAAAMKEALQVLMPTRTGDEWEAFLSAIGVPSAKARTLHEAVRLAQIEQRGLLHDLPPIGEVNGLRVAGAAFRFGSSGPAITSSPPTLGQHTDEILAGLGIASAEVNRLRTNGVV